MGASFLFLWSRQLLTLSFSLIRLHHQRKNYMWYSVLLSSSNVFFYINLSIPCLGS